MGGVTKLIVLREKDANDYYIGECYGETLTTWYLLPGSVFWVGGMVDYNYAEKWKASTKNMFDKGYFRECSTTEVEYDLYEQLLSV